MTKTDKISEQTAEILLNLKAVTLNPKKPFRYSSGILSPVYTDCRIIISNPKERLEIINLFIQKIKSSKFYPQVIAATATAGIPHASWIADRLNLPMVYVRGKAKDHGKENKIEGIIKKNQIAVVIEDLVSTGESSVGTVNAIREAGGKINSIFSIITYGMKKSIDNFKLNKINLMSLTTFSDVLEVARNDKKITEQEEKIISQWAKDPQNWGRQMGFE